MSLQNKFTLDVDFKKSTHINEPVVTQNDEVTFILNVYDDDMEFDLSTVSTFTLVSVRPDRQSVMTLGNKTGTNQVTFALGSTEISKVGKINAVIQLYDVGGRVSTLPFTYQVLKDPVENYVPSTDEQTLIELVLGQGPAILEAAKQATEDALEAVEFAIEAIEDVGIAIDGANQAADNANDKANLADAAATNADEKATLADTAAINAENAKDAALQAKSDTEQATENAVNATEAVTIVLPNVLNLEYIAPYDSATQYEKNNIVRHGKNSYIALQDTLGNEPTGSIDSPFWGVIALGGVDGLGSVVTVNGVGPDSNGNVILTIPDPDLSEYVKKEELEDTSKHSLTLNRGVQVVTVPIGSPVNVLNFKGKTIINFVPLFDSGLWFSDPGTAFDSVVIDAPNKVRVTKNNNVQRQWKCYFSVKPNTTYTISSIDDYRYGVIVAEYNGNTYLKTTANTENGNSTFTTGGSTNKLEVSIIVVAEYTGTFTFENVMLNEGSSAKEFVANVKGVTNPTIEVRGKNLVKSFTNGSWDGIGNFTFGVNEATFTTTKTDTSERAKMVISVKPNTTYTLSFEGTGSIAIDLKTSFQLAPWNFTFTTGASEKQITLVMSNTTIGTFNVKNIMLNEGSSALPFDPYRSDSMTVLGTFHEGDVVNRGIVTRKKKEVVTDGSLDWIHDTGDNVPGRKLVYFKSDSLWNVQHFVKYDGKLLTPYVNGWAVDVYYSANSGGNNFVELAISNADTGFGDSYIPTAADWKAYFMGWRMRTEADANAVYNGTGLKGWGYLGNPSSGWTTNVPTTMQPNNYWWQPYRLIYDLATPIVETIKTIGSLKFTKGDNVVELTEGRIARERANPILERNTVPYGDVYNINNNYNKESLLKYKADTILNAYKNGELEKRIIKYGNTTTVAGAMYQILKGDFDPTAIYETEYLPLEPYKVSANTNPITIEYRDTTGGVVDELVEDVTNLQSRMSSNESVMNELIKGNGNVYVRRQQGEWKNAILQNGWTGTINYVKNDLGQVTLRLSLVSGTIALGTIISTLPKGYESFSNIINLYINSGTFSGSLVVDSLGGIKVSSSGLATGTNYFAEVTYLANS